MRKGVWQKVRCPQRLSYQSGLNIADEFGGGELGRAKTWIWLSSTSASCVSWTGSTSTLRGTCGRKSRIRLPAAPQSSAAKAQWSLLRHWVSRKVTLLHKTRVFHQLVPPQQMHEHCSDTLRVLPLPLGPDSRPGQPLHKRGQNGVRGDPFP